MHGEELATVVIDLAPGADRVDMRTAAGLVRAGWTFRWRDRPGPRVLLGYRLLDVRIPARYRGWAHDDITGPLHPLRSAAWSAALLFGFLALSGLDVLPMLAVYGVATVLMDPITRRRLVRRHLVPGAGEWPTPWDVWWTPEQRTRVPAVQMLSWVVPALAVLTVGAGAAFVAAPSKPGMESCGTGCWESVTVAASHAAVALAVAGVAAVAGAVLALRLSLRFARTLPALPAQPARVLVGLPWRGRVGLVVGTAVLLAELAYESRNIPVVAPVVLALGLLALPTSLLAWVASRRSGAAFVDVWRIATLREPRVDTVAARVRPVRPPVGPWSVTGVARR
jgi:hypothetical protein